MVNHCFFIFRQIEYNLYYYFLFYLSKNMVLFVIRYSFLGLLTYFFDVKINDFNFDPL